MGFIATAASLIGTGIAAYSQIQAGKAAAQAGKVNAEIARNQGRQAFEEGRAREERIRTRNAQRMSAFKAKMAGSGIDPGSGSSLDFLATAAQRLEMEALDEAYRSTAAQRSAGHSANLASWQGRQTQAGQTARGYGTLLTGIARTGYAADQYGWFKSAS